MKSFIIVVAVLCLSFAPAKISNPIKEDCTCKGKKMYGKVRVVTAFEDFKVREVTAFEDLKVMKVNAFADACGKWQFVDAFEDFTIRYVTAFEDIKIRYVTAFPGRP